MTTDDERREVATRLRNNASQDMAWVIPWAVFNDAEQHASEAVVRRLADLIEPPKQCPYYDSGRHRCSIHDVPTIDRDALLALADELEAQQANKGIRQIGPYMQPGEAARRIRKALGVEP